MVVVVVVIAQGLGSSPLLLGKRLGMVMTAVLVALKKAGSRGLSLLSGKAVAGGKPLSSSSDKEVLARWCRYGVDEYCSHREKLEIGMAVLVIHGEAGGESERRRRR